MAETEADLRRRIAELEAQLRAAQSGAIAAGSGAQAAGAGAAVVGGDLSGMLVAGGVGGHAIAGDFVQIVVSTSKPGSDPDEARSIIAHYLQALARDLAGLRLGEIDAGASQPDREPLQLADVYVPLDTQLQVPANLPLAEWLKKERRHPGPNAEEHHELRPVSALEALAVHRELTILGNAGSGKSTLGASALLALAQCWLGHADEMRHLGEHWTHGAPLPIRVVLRRFAAALPPGHSPARAGDLWQFIAGDLRDSGYGLSDQTAEHIQAIARDHGALILLDGLDECGDPTRRGRVMHAVQELMRTAGPRCRFLLTARPYAWPAGANPAAGVYALAEFSDEQVETFLTTWYGALVRRRWLSAAEAERKQADLMRVWLRRELELLARNPLLLTLMATLHTNRGRLPDDRAELYNDSVDLLLLRWNRQVDADKALLDALEMPTLKLSDVRAVLERLAFDVHESNAGSQGCADIGEDRLVRAFRPLLNQSKDKADILVDYIEKRAGLLIGQGEKDGERQFTFPHRSFQEFLAACHLQTRSDFSVECKRLACAAPGHWQIVLALAARLAKTDRGASAADVLIGSRSYSEFPGRPGLKEWTCARLAGLQLQELGLNALRSDERASRIADRVISWLVAALPVHPNNGGMSAAERAQAGDVLAILGDPRFDPQRYFLPADPLWGFVHIPADPNFVIGTSSAARARVQKILGFEIRDNDINDCPSPTADFYIARYPVTVAQFRAYVGATGRSSEVGSALRDPDNRPVHFISWSEALAYCDWLNDRLRADSAFCASALGGQGSLSGWQLGLPSELEWEKAVRGDLRDAVYAWGDEFDAERANTIESGIGDTSAVGCFPPNAHGIQDLTGNVWEWTRSAYAPYPYDPGDGREARDGNRDRNLVLRGGSCLSRRDSASCFRLMGPPVGRGLYVGFRVVLRRSPGP